MNNKHPYRNLAGIESVVATASKFDPAGAMINSYSNENINGDEQCPKNRRNVNDGRKNQSERGKGERETREDDVRRNLPTDEQKRERERQTPIGSDLVTSFHSEQYTRPIVDNSMANLVSTALHSAAIAHQDVSLATNRSRRSSYTYDIASLHSYPTHFVSRYVRDHEPIYPSIPRSSNSLYRKLHCLDASDEEVIDEEVLEIIYLDHYPTLTERWGDDTKPVVREQGELKIEDYVEFDEIEPTITEEISYEIIYAGDRIQSTREIHHSRVESRNFRKVKKRRTKCKRSKEQQLNQRHDSADRSNPIPQTGDTISKLSNDLPGDNQRFTATKNRTDECIPPTTSADQSANIDIIVTDTLLQSSCKSDDQNRDGSDQIKRTHPNHLDEETNEINRSSFNGTDKTHARHDVHEMVSVPRTSINQLHDDQSKTAESLWAMPEVDLLQAIASQPFHVSATEQQSDRRLSMRGEEGVKEVGDEHPQSPVNAHSSADVIKPVETVPNASPNEHEPMINEQPLSISTDQTIEISHPQQQLSEDASSATETAHTSFTPSAKMGAVPISMTKADDDAHSINNSSAIVGKQIGNIFERSMTTIPAEQQQLDINETEPTVASAVLEFVKTAVNTYRPPSPPPRLRNNENVELPSVQPADRVHPTKTTTYQSPNVFSIEKSTTNSQIATAKPNSTAIESLASKLENDSMEPDKNLHSPKAVSEIISNEKANVHDPVHLVSNIDNKTIIEILPLRTAVDRNEAFLQTNDHPSPPNAFAKPVWIPRIDQFASSLSNSDAVPAIPNNASNDLKLDTIPLPTETATVSDAHSAHPATSETSVNSTTAVESTTTLSDVLTPPTTDSTGDAIDVLQVAFPTSSFSSDHPEPTISSTSELIDLDQQHNLPTPTIQPTLPDFLPLAEAQVTKPHGSLDLSKIYYELQEQRHNQTLFHDAEAREQQPDANDHIKSYNLSSFSLVSNLPSREYCQVFGSAAATDRIDQTLEPTISNVPTPAALLEEDLTDRQPISHVHQDAIDVTIPMEQLPSPDANDIQDELAVTPQTQSNLAEDQSEQALTHNETSANITSPEALIEASEEDVSSSETEPVILTTTDENLLPVRVSAEIIDTNAEQPDHSVEPLLANSDAPNVHPKLTCAENNPILAEEDRPSTTLITSTATDLNTGIPEATLTSTADETTTTFESSSLHEPITPERKQSTSVNYPWYTTQYKVDPTIYERLSPTGLSANTDHNLQNAVEHKPPHHGLQVIGDTYPWYASHYTIVDAELRMAHLHKQLNSACLCHSPTAPRSSIDTPEQVTLQNDDDGFRTVQRRKRVTPSSAPEQKPTTSITATKVSLSPDIDLEPVVLCGHPEIPITVPSIIPQISNTRTKKKHKKKKKNKEEIILFDAPDPSYPDVRPSHTDESLISEVDQTLQPEATQSHSNSPSSFTEQIAGTEMQQRLVFFGQPWYSTQYKVAPTESERLFPSQPPHCADVRSENEVAEESLCPDVLDIYDDYPWYASHYMIVDAEAKIAQLFGQLNLAFQPPALPTILESQEESSEQYSVQGSEAQVEDAEHSPTVPYHPCHTSETAQVNTSLSPLISTAPMHSADVDLEPTTGGAAETIRKKKQKKKKNNRSEMTSYNVSAPPVIDEHHPRDYIAPSGTVEEEEREKIIEASTLDSLQESETIDTVKERQFNDVPDDKTFTNIISTSNMDLRYSILLDRLYTLSQSLLVSSSTSASSDATHNTVDPPNAEEKTLLPNVFENDQLATDATAPEQSTSLPYGILKQAEASAHNEMVDVNQSQRQPTEVTPSAEETSDLKDDGKEPLTPLATPETHLSEHIFTTGSPPNDNADHEPIALDEHSDVPLTTALQTANSTKKKKHRKRKKTKKEVTVSNAPEPLLHDVNIQDNDNVQSSIVEDTDPASVEPNIFEQTPEREVNASEPIFAASPSEEEHGTSSASVTAKKKSTDEASDSTDMHPLSTPELIVPPSANEEPTVVPSQSDKLPVLNLASARSRTSPPDEEEDNEGFQLVSRRKRVRSGLGLEKTPPAPITMPKQIVAGETLRTQEKTNRSDVQRTETDLPTGSESVRPVGPHTEKESQSPGPVTASLSIVANTDQPPTLASSQVLKMETIHSKQDDDDGFQVVRHRKRMKSAPVSNKARGSSSTGVRSERTTGGDIHLKPVIIHGRQKSAPRSTLNADNDSLRSKPHKKQTSSTSTWSKSALTDTPTSTTADVSNIEAPSANILLETEQPQLTTQKDQEVSNIRSSPEQSMHEVVEEDQGVANQQHSSLDQSVSSTFNISSADTEKSAETDDDDDEFFLVNQQKHSLSSTALTVFNKSNLVSSTDQQPASLYVRPNSLLPSILPKTITSSMCITKEPLVTNAETDKHLSASLTYDMDSTPISIEETSTENNFFSISDDTSVTSTTYNSARSQNYEPPSDAHSVHDRSQKDRPAKSITIVIKEADAPLDEATNEQNDSHTPQSPRFNRFSPPLSPTMPSPSNPIQTTTTKTSPEVPIEPSNRSVTPVEEEQVKTVPSKKRIKRRKKRPPTKTSRDEDSTSTSEQIVHPQDVGLQKSPRSVLVTSRDKPGPNLPACPPFPTHFSAKKSFDHQTNDKLDLFLPEYIRQQLNVGDTSTSSASTSFDCIRTNDRPPLIPVNDHDAESFLTIESNQLPIKQPTTTDDDDENIHDDDDEFVVQVIETNPAQKDAKTNAPAQSLDNILSRGFYLWLQEGQALSQSIDKSSTSSRNLANVIQRIVVQPTETDEDEDSWAFTDNIKSIYMTGLQAEKKMHTTNGYVINHPQFHSVSSWFQRQSRDDQSHDRSKQFDSDDEDDPSKDTARRPATRNNHAQSSVTQQSNSTPNHLQQCSVEQSSPSSIQHNIHFDDWAYFYGDQFDMDLPVPLEYFYTRPFDDDTLICEVLPLHQPISHRRSRYGDFLQSNNEFTPTEPAVTCFTYKSKPSTYFQRWRQRVPFSHDNDEVFVSHSKHGLSRRMKS